MTSHESLKVRDFGKFLQKIRKFPIFAQKVIISVKKYQKFSLKPSDQNFFDKSPWFFRDFEVFCSWFSWFWMCFLARDFRDFLDQKSWFPRKIIWEHCSVKKSQRRRIKKKYIIAIGIISNLAYYNISVENLRLVLIIINLI